VTNRMPTFRLCFAILSICSCAALATESENLGIAVLPAPGKVVVDGKIDDWDLSGGVFVCGDVENQRGTFAVWLHAMYDQQNLYLLGRWIDETPLNNPGQVEGSYGFAGDCLQFRTVLAPGTPQECGNHFTCWQDRNGKDVIFVECGKDFKGGTIKDAKSHGAQQAFRKNEDGKGYVQEIALPWRLLSKDGQPPRAGETFTMTVEPNFTIGAEGRLSLKDIFKPGVTPDRVFTFMSSNCWGPATLERRGHIEPRALRLADARTFRVRLENGIPVVDWTGLVKTQELKGFKPIRFTMPEDGYISLQILGAQGQVVRQLLSTAPMKKGPHEVQWDGLTTMNYRTPGEAVPPGTYTWRAIWHKGVGLRLCGWAGNSGAAPWDSDPTSNWGGDHGVPVACAAGGGQVYLGWSGAEAGKALLACDLAGNIRWKNNRQGMAGAEFVAVDENLVYAVNWGADNSNYVYRLQADSGAYVQWSDGSPDLFLKDIFPDPRSRPNRIDGLAARDGRLYLTLASTRLCREHLSNWRSLLTKLKTGGGLAGAAWKKLDAGARQRAEQWLAGSQSEDEGLKAPNYYTPDVRDAVVAVLNDMLADRSLAAQSGALSADALAAANRRGIEAAFPGEVVPLKTGLVAVVDARSRKLLSTWQVPLPRPLAAAGDNVVYVVSDGKTLLALDSTNGKTRQVLGGLQNASGVAVDRQGQIYVALRDPQNQVQVFAPDGRLLRAIGRPGGRRLLGPWQRDGMAFAQGIAVDSAGQLWVAEADMSPKRISVWDAKTGRFVREFFGPTTYGALGGAINPLDPALMVGSGCEWRIDPLTGRADCLGTFTREGMSNARFGIGGNGRLYLAVASGWAFETSPVRIFERVGDVDFRLRAMFSYEGQDKTARTVFWSDENGDGRRQPQEITRVEGHVRFSGWYMRFAPDMSLDAGNRHYAVAGFTSCGAPKYDLAKPVKMPAEGTSSADGRLVLSSGEYGATGSWLDCYDIASGKKLWSYPDNFVGVHGSHQACPPVVGMIRGDFGPCGTAKLPAPIGNIWVLPTNVGEWHILTENGFYLAKLFEGDGMKIRWPAKAVPGAVLDNVPPGMGGEDFGGSICYARNGKLYVQAGKTAFWNVEVVGLDSVRTLGGGQVIISAGEVAEAEKLRVQYLQAAVGTRKATARKKTPELTGDFDKDFAAAEVIQFQKQDDAAVRAAATWDDRNLYLAWDVRDRTPWVNAARVPEEMYMSGDTVDFQIGTDPKADKQRSEAGAGDLRLSIGNFQGQPRAVLYRKVSGVKRPKQFSSGVVKDYRMDYVDVLSAATIKVRVRPGDGYVVEAALPLAALELRPADGLALQADFGATHGGPDGQRTRLRTYWNNQHTGIVDDVVFELMLEPKNWGELEFRN